MRNARAVAATAAAVAGGAPAATAAAVAVASAASAVAVAESDDAAVLQALAAASDEAVLTKLCERKYGVTATSQMPSEKHTYNCFQCFHVKTMFSCENAPINIVVVVRYCMAFSQAGHCKNCSPSGVLTATHYPPPFHRRGSLQEL